MNSIQYGNQNSFFFLKFVFFFALIVNGLLTHSSSTPEDLATSEVRVWKAYYAQDTTEITAALKGFLNSHYRTRDLSDKQIESYATALLAFAKTDQQAPLETYQETVFPLLQAAFHAIHTNSTLFYVADALARAELAWWVERRQLHATVESVAVLMEESYRVLYKGENSHYERMCWFRASVARYRDLCQDKFGGTTEDDWEAIQKMLVLGYQALPKLASPTNV